MNQQELLYSIALTKLKGLSLLNARTLLDTLGSASEIFAHRKDILSVIPDATERLAKALANVDDALKQAEREMEFVEEKRLKVFALHDNDYPQRLKECDDAPLVLYYCGSADLNRQHIINIVGTRKCTEYGKELCHQLITDLKTICPDTLIISGLAYGIDIFAHRTCLDCSMDTAAVLAHGLDIIYPSMHRQTAAEIVRQGGGLLTEYTTQTKPERHNFVHRNRIVAGLCDACVVIESAAKGGSLITAELANSYHRDVFAFPGRIHDEHSAGCNQLIQQHQAQLLTNAVSLAEALGWYTPTSKSSSSQPIQQDLFPDLNDEERALIHTLKNVDDKHINQISIDTNIPYPRASMILFELEMKGIVKALGGSRFRLIRRIG